MERAKITISIDTGKTFGYAIFLNENTLIESGAIEIKDAKQPYELKKFLKEQIQKAIDLGYDCEVIAETGQGFLSKNAWRAFGVYEWTIISICEDYGLKHTEVHCSWLTKYERRLEKTDENDAIELAEYVLNKRNEENQND